MAAVADGRTPQAVEAWCAKPEGWAPTFIRHHGDAFDGSWLIIRREEYSAYSGSSRNSWNTGILARGKHHNGDQA
jgi:hypothetical protein